MLKMFYKCYKYKYYEKKSSNILESIIFYERHDYRFYKIKIFIKGEAKWGFVNSNELNNFFCKSCICIRTSNF